MHFKRENVIKKSLVNEKVQLKIIFNIEKYKIIFICLN